VARRSRCSTVDALRTQELFDRVGGLGASGEPVLDLGFVEHNGRRLGLCVVMADGLDYATVALGSLIGDNNPPNGVLASADAC
jgi:hypothetical protein